MLADHAATNRRLDFVLFRFIILRPRHLAHLLATVRADVLSSDFLGLLGLSRLALFPYSGAGAIG